MKSSVLINGFKLILLLITISIIVFLWVNRQLKKSRGSFTDLSIAHEVVKPYSKIILKNVNILSPDCTQFIPNKNVVLQDGIIKSINSDSIFDNSITVIDGQGNYLIPGLVDSHVHLRDSKNDLLLYLTNGITYIREMSGNMNHKKWKNEIKQGG